MPPAPADQPRGPQQPTHRVVATATVLAAALLTTLALPALATIDQATVTPVPVAEPAGPTYPAYRVLPLGLTLEDLGDPTRVLPTSYAVALNHAGQVVGNTAFNRTFNLAWFQSPDAPSPRQLGLTGPAYINTDTGFPSSLVGTLNHAGQSAGTSNVFDGSTLLGRVAWLDHGSAHQPPARIGLAHPAAGDSFEFDAIRDLNDAGHVLGSTNRPSLVDLGPTAAWIYNGHTTRQIGLTQGPFQRPADGHAVSRPEFLNDLGHAVGYSERYEAGGQTSYVAWIDRGQGSVPIGLSGPGYRNTATGQSSQLITNFDDTGHALGYSLRFNGSQPAGWNAWIDDGSGPVQLGFTGPGYQTTFNQYETSQPAAANKAGQVIGVSSLAPGFGPFADIASGFAAWIDDASPAPPRRLGFTGPGYQNTTTGYEASTPTDINDAGQTIGSSDRYQGTTRTGHAAWFDDGQGPRAIGLTGPAYVSDDGYAANFARYLNDAGQVVGVAERYSGVPQPLEPGQAGRAAWFYDTNTDITHELIFSTRDDGFAFTQPRLLTEDGTVLGFYTLFDAAATIGDRLFAWNVEEGFIDLQQRTTNFTEDDWDNLSRLEFRRVNESGYFLFEATRDGQRRTESFLLYPEPAAAAWLMLLSFTRCRSSRA